MTLIKKYKYDNSGLILDIFSNDKKFAKVLPQKILTDRKILMTMKMDRR